MLGKADVVGDNTCPVFKNLKEQAPDAVVEWNFAKYLVDGSGKVVKFYHHEVNPSDMLPDIEALLND